MSRKKTRKFEQNKHRLNIVEPGKPLFEKIKGNWRSAYFQNDRPIVVELACGRGEYSVGLGRVFPERNFIGVDLKGDRLWAGSGIALEEGLTNVAFLRTQMQAIENFFDEDEVDEMWLVFPDPRPKDRDEKRRLTHPRYLGHFNKILKKDGWFRLKTDNTLFFDYTLDLISNGIVKVKDLAYTKDLYNSPLMDEHHGITTKYERLWTEKGETIKYLKFKFDTE